MDLPVAVPLHSAVPLHVCEGVELKAKMIQSLVEVSAARASRVSIGALIPLLSTEY